MIINLFKAGQKPVKALHSQRMSQGAKKKEVAVKTSQWSYSLIPRLSRPRCWSYACSSRHSTLCITWRAAVYFSTRCSAAAGAPLSSTFFLGTLSTFLPNDRCHKHSFREHARLLPHICFCCNSSLL